MIPAGFRGTITFTVSVATTAFIAHLVETKSRRVLGSFAYPTKTGYQLLTKLGNVYSGIVTEAMTIRANEGGLSIEVKPFISTNDIPIGIGEIEERLKRNTLEGVE